MLARHPAPSALKLRTFLEPLTPALSCVSSSVQVVPPGLEQHRSSTQEVPLALTGIDGETSVGLTFPGPVYISQVFNLRCAEAPALPGALVSCTELL
ncbi:uncharacterized protein [Chlorocebus sabaeus]|uniref:uncharacterized protein isoform X3 n=1 Tax=Chlorocebus sabaeus TaxID=60711 RepID=UPI003BF9BDF0